jgi:cell division protein FtsB
VIQINLLPPEYRARAGTPVARFAAIVVGVVMVLGAAGAFAYTRYIALANAKEIRQVKENEARSKEAQKERSLQLAAEIDVYERRREAIQKITRARTLWSRKLDQFFDIVTNQATQETFHVWLDTIEAPTQLAAGRRPTGKAAARRKTLTPAGELKFAGFLAMENDAEALALMSSFHKALTGDPENTGRATEFYADFMSINNPNIEMLREGASRRDRAELTPPRVGAFGYELKLHPLEVGMSAAKPAKAKQ